MDESDRRCDHPRLVRIAFDGPPLPMFGNVFQCEECKTLVEVVIGRTITTQQLRDFADAIETGKAKPSVMPGPADRPDSVEELGEDDIIGSEDDTWGGTDGGK